MQTLVNPLPCKDAQEAFRIAGAHAQAKQKCKLFKESGVWYVAI